MLPAQCASAATFTGTVFEDANYGGGAGRARVASGGTVLPNVVVELYRVSDGALHATPTRPTPAASTRSTPATPTPPMRVRVVNGSVRSARTGGAACTTCVPVQTFRTDAATGTAVAVTNRVGGETPGVERRGRESRAVQTTRRSPPADACRSRSRRRRPPRPTTTITGIDFGFNFDTVVNTRDVTACGATNSSYPCQGSLRQFVINANALGGEGALSQSGSGQIDGATSFLPGGAESSIFMIPSAALTGGVAVITLGAALPAHRGREHAARRHDADRQHRQHQRGHRSAPAASSASMPFRCRRFRGPEVQLAAGNTVLTLSGGSTAVLGLALRQGYLLLTGTGCLARNNLVGMTASGDSSDNSPTTYGIEFAGTNATVRNNFVTVNNSGIRAQNGGAGSLVTLNEVARPTSGHTDTFDGILLVGTVSVDPGDREPHARAARRRHRSRLRRRRIRDQHHRHQQHRAQQRIRDRRQWRIVHRAHRHGRLRLRRLERRVQPQPHSRQRRRRHPRHERERHLDHAEPSSTATAA